MSERTPSLAQFLNEFRQQLMADLRVSCPGKIVRYDEAKQLADVEPQLAGQFQLEDGTVQNVRLKPIPNCKVQFPGSGALRITWPVRVGDTCMLLFSDRSLDAWLNNGGFQTPADQRAHALSDAIALLGVNPNPGAFSGFEANVITIGSNTGASEFVATAQRVLTELNKLKTAFDGHTHSVPASGLSSPSGAVTGTATTAGASASPSLSAPASSTVKIRG